MPRPTVPPAERRRKPVNLQVPEATWAWIREQATATHTTVGTWLRWFAFQHIPAPDAPRPRDPGGSMEPPKEGDA